ncbi:hypothetical protein BDV93DRAFT_526023 [Ceratobasidium sp. AG-I]|nr:hypothetical protein BDV93DRAFT_526023 [Ceratobasidium sp. AG-I]
MSSETVSIEDCTAVQVLATQDIPLSSGTLQLLEAPATGIEPTSPILTLKIGNAAFPLTKSTTFYTHATSPRIYVFSPVLEEAALGAGTYVKITLPEDIGVAGSEAERARNSFEEVLIKHGLLQEDPVAVASELSADARQAGQSAASFIQGVARSHTSGPPNAPSTFSPTTHSAADSAVSGTATLQSYTSSASQTMASVGTSIGNSAGTALSKASETIARAGVTVGERLVHLFGAEDQVERVSSADGGPKFDNAGTSGAFNAANEDDEEAKYGDGTGPLAKQVGDAVGEVSSGVRAGAATTVSATRDAATSILQHDAGPEAVELANKSGEAIGNVGKATEDLALATSAVATAGYIAAGATEEHGEANEKHLPELPEKDVLGREDVGAGAESLDSKGIH